MAAERAAFDRLPWRDPLSGTTLTPLVTTRTPGGVPLCGALRAERGWAYPVVDAVARLTPVLAHQYRSWLAPLSLEPPPLEPSASEFQPPSTVESFGFQWSWNAEMRSEADLRWRAAERFGLAPSVYEGKVVLDAGAGAGDQSRWMLHQRSSCVVSVDLSAAIEVVARKLREEPRWVGIQGDVSSLPFQDTAFDIVYCEGVIQHTADSARTVLELCRVTRRSGLVLATHYQQPKGLASRMKVSYQEWLRRRLSRLDRHRLLLLTGSMAALGFAPLLGRFVRASGTALHYDLMPDFKTSWTNTYDFYGGHAHQRYVTPEEFWRFFQAAGDFERLRGEGNCVVARRRTA
jgi:ubiquinone/menaquinone biosynthesis C-methylase UbiE